MLAFMFGLSMTEKMPGHHQKRLLGSACFLYYVGEARPLSHKRTARTRTGSHRRIGGCLGALAAQRQCRARQSHHTATHHNLEFFFKIMKICSIRPRRAPVSHIRMCDGKTKTSSASPGGRPQKAEAFSPSASGGVLVTFPA
jgi:hypothetical protein